MMSWGGGGFWAMVLLSIVFVAALIVGIALLVRSLSGSRAGGGAGERASQDLRETPEELVRRRYAAGDIDRDEYEQKLRDLRT